MSLKKTLSRIFAVQALYQFQLNNENQPIREIANNLILLYKNNEIFDDLSEECLASLSSINKKHYFELLDFCVDNMQNLDKDLVEYFSKDIALDSIDVCTLSILRLGFAELKFFPDVPQKVVINEYTNIASEFLKKQDIGFVNSVLDKCANDK